MQNALIFQKEMVEVSKISAFIFMAVFCGTRKIQTKDEYFKSII